MRDSETAPGVEEIDANAHTTRTNMCRGCEPLLTSADLYTSGRRVGLETAWFEKACMFFFDFGCSFSSCILVILVVIFPLQTVLDNSVLTVTSDNVV